MQKYITRQLSTYTATARVYNTQKKQEDEYIVEALTESGLRDKVKTHDVLLELSGVAVHLIKYKLTLDRFITEAKKEMGENA